MRLKLGRPDLAAYTRYFDQPAAGTDSPLTVTWATRRGPGWPAAG